MKLPQNTKYANLIGPGAAVNGSAFSSTAVDCLGFTYASIVCHFGASDVAITKLNVAEGDSADGDFEDITGLSVGSSDNIDGSDSALPTATDDDGIVVFEIDLRFKKRFLKLYATADSGSTGCYASAFAILGRPTQEEPQTIAERGTLEILRV